MILDAEATVEKARRLLGEAAADGAQLAVLPEALPVPFVPTLVAAVGDAGCITLDLKSSCSNTGSVPALTRRLIPRRLNGQQAGSSEPTVPRATRSPVRTQGNGWSLIPVDIGGLDAAVTETVRLRLCERLTRKPAWGKRRGRDLNPRDACTPNGFRDRLETGDVQGVFGRCASSFASTERMLGDLADSNRRLPPYHRGFGLLPRIGGRPLAASLSLHLPRFLCVHPFLEAAERPWIPLTCPQNVSPRRSVDALLARPFVRQVHACLADRPGHLG